MFCGLALLTGARAEAQTTISLSADPQMLIVSEAVAGSTPHPATDATTTYSLDLGQTSSILARLDGPLPTGVTLRIRLFPPAGAADMGVVTLTTLSQTVVASIPAGTYTGYGITYELSATVEAGVVPLNVRQVVFEIVTEQQD